MKLTPFFLSYVVPMIYIGYSFLQNIPKLFKAKKDLDICYPFGNIFKCYNFSRGQSYFSPTFRKRRLPSTDKKSKVKRYTRKGFVKIEEGDVCVDIGAFIGEFSIPASLCAKQVYCFEPDQRNFSALSLNTRSYSNIKCINVAISDKVGIQDFYIAEDPSDNSLFDIDKGAPQLVLSVPTFSLYRILKLLSVNKVDFLKVDAEGMEPEVVRGIGDTEILKIAVDCGPERGGEKTIDATEKILAERGYEIEVDENSCVLFARKDFQH